MKMYLYPEESKPVDGTDPRDKFYDDPRRFKFALYNGTSGSTHVYKVLPENREAAEALARAHGCSEIYYD